MLQIEVAENPGKSSRILRLSLRKQDKEGLNTTLMSGGERIRRRTDGKGSRTIKDTILIGKEEKMYRL